ncbi:MAG TPA: SprT family zinc-dependent metalloprotease [Candidatus Saccharimonadales bacterium]|nr:SprT family zinc-dependent metalloprotease [Candidatus Saccharimonadales bacterium]
MPTTSLQDAEFGAIAIRRSALARSLRLKVNERGSLVISMPKRAPLYLAKQLVDEARDQVRKSLKKTQSQLTVLQNSDMIGKSHRLVIRDGDELSGRLIGNFIEVTLPPAVLPESPKAQEYIKEFALKALRTQAKAYLSRRLKELADRHGFRYENVRFSNAGTRWGSCSSSGTISLNIWLMQLPFDLIDYVIVHELCHTRQMNHSPQFWSLVEAILPNYRELRRTLKAKRPYL